MSSGGKGGKGGNNDEGKGGKDDQGDEGHKGHKCGKGIGRSSGPYTISPERFSPQPLPPQLWPIGQRLASSSPSALMPSVGKGCKGGKGGKDDKGKSDNGDEGDKGNKGHKCGKGIGGSSGPYTTPLSPGRLVPQPLPSQMLPIQQRPASSSPSALMLSVGKGGKGGKGGKDDKGKGDNSDKGDTGNKGHKCGKGIKGIQQLPSSSSPCATPSSPERFFPQPLPQQMWPIPLHPAHSPSPVSSPAPSETASLADIFDDYGATRDAAAEAAEAEMQLLFSDWESPSGSSSDENNWGP
jgi:hypothetical protein